MRRVNLFVMFLVVLQSCKNEDVENGINVSQSEVSFLNLSAFGVTQVSFVENGYMKICTFPISESEFVKLFWKFDLVEIESPKGYFASDGKMFDDKDGIRNPDVWTNDGLYVKNGSLLGGGKYAIYDRAEGYGCYSEVTR